MILLGRGGEIGRRREAWPLRVFGVAVGRRGELGGKSSRISLLLHYEANERENRCVLHTWLHNLRHSPSPFDITGTFIKVTCLSFAYSCLLSFSFIEIDCSTKGAPSFLPLLFPSSSFWARVRWFLMIKHTHTLLTNNNIRCWPGPLPLLHSNTHTHSQMAFMGWLDMKLGWLASCLLFFVS